LNGLESLGADAARALADWGRSSTERLSLSVAFSAAPSVEGLAALCTWGDTDDAARGASRELTVRVANPLTPAEAAALARWGRRATGSRSLRVTVPSIDGDTATALLVWGDAAPGERSIRLDG